MSSYITSSDVNINKRQKAPDDLSWNVIFSKFFSCFLNKFSETKSRVFIVTLIEVGEDVNGPKHTDNSLSLVFDNNNLSKSDGRLR